LGQRFDDDLAFGEQVGNQPANGLATQAEAPVRKSFISYRLRFVREAAGFSQRSFTVKLDGWTTKSVRAAILVEPHPPGWDFVVI